MKHIILALSLFISVAVAANENSAFLDAPYKNLVHPIDSKSNFKALSKSDFLELKNLARFMADRSGATRESQIGNSSGFILNHIELNQIINLGVVLSD